MRHKQERNDKLRGGGVNEGKQRAGVHNRWKDCGMDEEKGRRDLIFSSVIQSSEVLALLLRL